MSEPSVVDRLRAAGCVFAEEEAALLESVARDPDDLAAMVDRRAAGRPLEQVVGWAELAGVRVAVDPGVFVPRRRTELLVREAVTVAAPGGIVVDLCCGVGAVGAAVMAARPDLELHAVDVDPAAVGCARRNLGGRGHVYEGDLYAPLPANLAGGVAAVVANAPYVPTGAIALLPAEARLHEPRIALDGGPDGLDVQRRVIAGAPGWLAAGGHLLVETSELQAEATAAACTGVGLTPLVARDPDLDATVVVATR